MSTTSSTTPTSSLGEQAYQRLRRLIVQLDFAPGDVLREDELPDRLGVGRTPLREALQRLAREHFVTVIPRRGMFVSGIDVAELSTLFETRSLLEPYVARLAAARGDDNDWDAMAAELSIDTSELAPAELLAVDRRCHEIMWAAAENRFLVDTLDTLYAQSDRLWHLHLAGVSDMAHAVTEHVDILTALRSGDGDTAAELVEQHVRSFDERIRTAITTHLSSPLTG